MKTSEAAAMELATGLERLHATMLCLGAALKRNDDGNVQACIDKVCREAVRYHSDFVTAAHGLPSESK